MVIGYLVDEFTCTPYLQSGLLLAPTFILGSPGKVLSLTLTFPWNLGFEDYSFLDQAVADFEQGFDSIFTDSSKTLELEHILV